jgi:hypothetical protein
MYGKESLQSSAQLYCGVVRLSASNQKTSVRADSSASRGTAIEVTYDSRLLFLPLTEIGRGDKLTIVTLELRVETVQPRFDIRGRLDHLQVDLIAWA